MPLALAAAASPGRPARRPVLLHFEEPEERPYGIDSAFRDPSGNHFRLTQFREFASV